MVESAPTGRRWSLASAPGLVVSFLPCIACPGCWPAYAGVLGWLGLGALMDRAWLLPIAAVALALAVFGLAYRAAQRRGFAPAVVGALASAAVLFGKFGVENDAITYAGALALGVATMWNAWPVPRAISCPTCASDCGESVS
jgi:mercuric ion transport protein